MTCVHGDHGRSSGDIAADHWVGVMCYSLIVVKVKRAFQTVSVGLCSVLLGVELNPAGQRVLDLSAVLRDVFVVESIQEHLNIFEKTYKILHSNITETGPETVLYMIYSVIDRSNYVVSLKAAKLYL